MVMRGIIGCRLMPGRVGHLYFAVQTLVSGPLLRLAACLTRAIKSDTILTGKLGLDAAGKGGAAEWGNLGISLKYLFGFRGRASRTEWWAVTLASFVPYIIAILLVPSGHDPGIPIAVLFAASILIMSYLGIACSVRRLHDRGKHGGWYFLYFLPIVGPMWM